MFWERMSWERKFLGTKNPGTCGGSNYAILAFHITLV